jgi:hypothetical protein
MNEQVQQLMDLDEQSEHRGIVLIIIKYLTALFLICTSTYIAYLQSAMTTKFEVLNERLIATNKQLDENRIFVQKLMIDLHAVELAVKELQFNQTTQRKNNVQNR